MGDVPIYQSQVNFASKNPKHKNVIARNASKAFRPIRTDKNGNPHPLDYMKVGVDRNSDPKNPKEFRGDTTGCWGIKNSFNGWFSLVVKAGAPGRSRPPRKRKSPARTFPGQSSEHYTRPAYGQVYNLRAKIHLGLIIEEFTKIRVFGDLNIFSGKTPKQYFKELTNWLYINYPAKINEISRSDEGRQICTFGRIRKGQIPIEEIKGLGNMVNRVNFTLRL